jgi:hypothetical protein
VVRQTQIDPELVQNRRRKLHRCSTEVFDAMEAGAIQAVTSTVTLVEVLVQPLAKSSQELASRYEQ